MKHPIAIAVAASMLSACAAAETPSPKLTAATAENTAPSDPGERTRCRRETTMGSNRPVKVCRTAAETAADLERAKRSIDHVSGGQAQGAPPER